VALADPDLPPGIALPELSPGPPLGLNADRYRWLHEAFYELPRRSRVVVVLRLPLPDRKPLTLDAIGALFGVTLERVRQLEHHAIWMLVRAWRLQVSPGDLNRDERMAEIAPILGVAIDRYPPDDDAERP
jgi:DNA-directed RNA polymerase specialized sigma24 family protein